MHGQSKKVRKDMFKRLVENFREESKDAVIECTFLHMGVIACMEV
jgi:hypothetical protein